VTKGSDLLTAALENEGVERIFGVPGEENLDVVQSLHGSKIDLVLTRHEQAAAFMAATYGRLTGRVGVCLSTLGPGGLHLCTGAGDALLGAMPMILITGRKAIQHRKQGRFQLVDVVGSMTPPKDVAPDRQRCDNPDDRARGLPRRPRRTPGAGAFGAAGGHRRRGDGRPCAGAAASE
jgi:thiamine pyrophosphate-dependent acetolactate synthase large subunit-like protein